MSDFRSLAEASEAFTAASAELADLKATQATQAAELVAAQADLATASASLAEASAKIEAHPTEEAIEARIQQEAAKIAAGSGIPPVDGGSSGGAKSVREQYDRAVAEGNIKERMRLLAEHREELYATLKG